MNDLKKSPLFELMEVQQIVVAIISCKLNLCCHNSKKKRKKEKRKEEYSTLLQLTQGHINSSQTETD